MEITVQTIVIKAQMIVALPQWLYSSQAVFYSRLKENVSDKKHPMNPSNNAVENLAQGSMLPTS